MVSQHSAKLGGYRNCVRGGKFLVVKEEDPHACLNPQLLFISKAHGMKHMTSCSALVTCDKSDNK